MIAFLSCLVQSSVPICFIAFGIEESTLSVLFMILIYCSSKHYRMYYMRIWEKFKFESVLSL